MGNGFQFFDIILFGLIAVFILLRLRSTLGSRPDDQGDGNNQPSRWQSRFNDQAESPDDTGDNVIPLPDNGRRRDSSMYEEEFEEAEFGQAAPDRSVDEELPVEIAAGIAEVRLSDPHFDYAQFRNGSVIAYEMVVGGFAAGDYAALRSLLADSVYDDFSAAIREREERGETLETTLIQIEEAEPIEIRMNGKHAEVTVKFIAEMVNVLRDEEGEVLSGTPDMPDEVVDIWTFARDTRSRDPNWQIVATRKAN